MAARDDGLAVHYTALERGTPVFSSDGQEVGKVDQVLDNPLHDYVAKLSETLRG